MSRYRVAVVGHLEWVEFLRVERVPAAGEIERAESRLAVPAGGGAVAAVQLARWGADCAFFTALGDDELGHRAHDELRARGVTVHAVFRADAQRRAITLVDAHRERTIITIGTRAVPQAADDLPWQELADCDAVYITGCDAEGVRRARRARVLVATSRVLSVIGESGVQLDALVGSAVDRSERYVPGDLAVIPHLVVRTEGERGGFYVLPDGSMQRYAPVVARVTGDTYGAGDTFAAGLTLALGQRKPLDDALAFAAERAAEVVAFEGPYPPAS
jgi:ribokinase